MENEKKNFLYELLKYPIITFCVVIGMIGVSKYAGIEFDKITKISSSGIEFANEQTSNALIAMNDSISKMQEKIEFLQEKTQSISPAYIGAAKPTSTVVSKTSELQRTEIVSQAIGRLSYVDAEKNTSLNGKSGYVWLGEYNGKWETQPLFRQVDGSMAEVKSAPTAIASKQYILTKSIKLRQNASNKGSEDIIGIIPEETTVLLKSVVKDKDDNQYWAFVEVTK